MLLDSGAGNQSSLLFAVALLVCFAGLTRYLSFPLVSSMSAGVRFGPAGTILSFCSKLSEALHEGGKIDLLTHRELQVAECAAQGQSNKQIADQLRLSEHTIKNYLFRIFDKLGVSNRFELLFLLFKECNAQATGRGGAPFGTEIGHPVETYLKAAEEGSVAAQFVVGVAHLEGYCVEKNGLSAYYWFRVAEASSSELGRRSRALVEQLRSTVKTDEIEALERNVAIAVKNNKFFASKRPVEFIRRSADSPPLRRVI